MKREPGAAVRLRLGEALVASRAISQEQLDATLRQQRLLLDSGSSVLLGELLVRNRFTTAAAVNDALASSGSRDATELPRDIVLLASADCVRHRVEPVRIENGKLIVRASRALNEADRRSIAAACSIRVDGVVTKLVDKHEMHRYLTAKIHHESFGALVERLRAADATPAQLKSAIDALLREAIDLRASDIHLDNKPDPDAWISLRIDSRLRQLYLLTTRTMAAVFSRVKTLSGMDASNSRTAQDGRMSIEHRGRIVGFRVATQPLVDGETMTIRVIDAASLPTAEALFPNQPRMLRLLNSVTGAEGKVGGLVLVTGPTGSGKSTTLYTLASRFPRDSANLLTVEDPVEYLLPFARQIQVSQMLNEKASDVERSVLRQDPDVLIFGEIRDAESARTALKFAESGHLVLATLHAQSSTQAVERLLSMVPDTDRSEAGLVLASTLLTIINQRLVRKLCDCATPLELEQLHALQMDAQSHFQAGFSLPRSLYQAVGCPHCDMSGYRGRVALHETLIFDLSDSERMAMGRHVSQYGTLTGLQDVNGMLVVRRAQVAYQLMECGFVDMATSMTFLAGALGSLESGDL